jgi:hypothetical protein
MTNRISGKCLFTAPNGHHHERSIWPNWLGQCKKVSRTLKTFMLVSWWCPFGAGKIHMPAREFIIRGRLILVSIHLCTVKKVYRIFRPQPGCHLPNSPRQGITKSLPARENLVCDKTSRLETGISLNFFYSVFSLDRLGTGKSLTFLQCVFYTVPLTTYWT